VGSFDEVFACVSHKSKLMSRIKAQKLLTCDKFLLHDHEHRFLFSVRQLNHMKRVKKFFDPDARFNIATMAIKGMFTIKRPLSEVNYVLMLAAIIGQEKTLPVKLKGKSEFKNKQGILVDAKYFMLLLNALHPGYCTIRKQGNANRHDFLIKITNSERCTITRFKDDRPGRDMLFFHRSAKKLPSKGNYLGSPYDLKIQLENLSEAEFDAFCDG